jgi:hypothetical protein
MTGRKMRESRRSLDEGALVALGKARNVNCGTNGECNKTDEL